MEVKQLELLDIIYAVILGIIQGITEWLPVSSTGHLSIFNHYSEDYSGYDPPIFFDLMLHLGTAIVVGTLFRRDIMMILRALAGIAGDVVKGVPLEKAVFADLDRRFATLLVIGTIPIVIAGALFRSYVIASFSNILVVGTCLIITGTVLWSSRHRAGEREVKDITVKDALAVGAFQAAALLPGISRSGMTISGGLLRGLSKTQATRFSFLLFFPAMLGAVVLQIGNWYDSFSSRDIVPTIAGTAAAMVSGYLSIRYLLRLIQKDSFYKFAYYCWGMGAFLLMHNLFLV